MDNILKNEGRLIWLDQLKAISMYLVVLGHSLLEFKKHNLFKLIYSFHMPLFFMISGFTFNPDKYDRIYDCIKDKMIKLVYPYILLNIIILPLWYINMKTGMIPDDSILELFIGIAYSNSAVVRAPSNATWFLMTLFLAEVIYYIIFRCMKEDKLVFLMSCIIAIIGIQSSFGKEILEAPFHLDVSLVAQFFYGCGYLLRKNFIYFKRAFETHTYTKVSLILISAVFFACINKQVDLSNELYRNISYTLITSFSFSFILIYLVQKTNLSFKVFSFIGQNTIIVLAFHILVLRVFQAYFPIFLSSQLFAVLASILVYISMIPIIWIVNKYFRFVIRMPMFLLNKVR